MILMHYDNKHITIVEVAILSIDKQIIKSLKTQIQIDPFGQNLSLIPIKNINKYFLNVSLTISLIMCVWK